MKKSLLALCFLGLSWQQIAAQTFTEVHQLTCGDTAYIGNLGYPTWNIADIVTASRTWPRHFAGRFYSGQPVAIHFAALFRGQ